MSLFRHDPQHTSEPRNRKLEFLHMAQSVLHVLSRHSPYGVAPLRVFSSWTLTANLGHKLCFGMLLCSSHQLSMLLLAGQSSNARKWYTQSCTDLHNAPVFRRAPYICICTCIYIYIYICMRICIYTYICVRIYVCIHMYMYIYIYMTKSHADIQEHNPTCRSGNIRGPQV